MIIVKHEINKVEQNAEHTTGGLAIWRGDEYILSLVLLSAAYWTDRTRLQAINFDSILFHTLQQLPSPLNSFSFLKHKTTKQ